MLFLGRIYAGHRTRFANLEAHSHDDPRIRPLYRRVSGWVDGGIIERTPLLPAGIKGRARAVIEGGRFAALPRPDAIWTSAPDAILPYLWAQAGPLRRPLVLDLDWTLEQQEAFAPVYFGRPAKLGLPLSLARRQERLAWSSVTLFTPWSNWAADSLRRQGIADDRIHVLPPGVDLQRWSPSPRLTRDDGPLRLLFVGGDFVRKGGDLLLEVMRSRFAGRCELDIVTREPVTPTPGVRVHRSEAGSPLLRELFAAADLFVMPSRAECFGIATIEAMACGLPVIAGNTGGAADIVKHGDTGWLIEPSAAALSAALDQALAHPDRLPVMGRRGRSVTEQRFDGQRNDSRAVDLVLAAIARHTSAPRLS